MAASRKAWCLGLVSVLLADTARCDGDASLQSLPNTAHTRLLAKAKPGFTVPGALCDVLKQHLWPNNSATTRDLSFRFGIVAVEVNDTGPVQAGPLATALTAHPGIKFAQKDQVLYVQQQDNFRAASSSLPRSLGSFPLQQSAAVNDPIWPAQWDKRAIGLTSRMQLSLNSTNTTTGGSRSRRSAPPPQQAPKSYQPFPGAWSQRAMSSEVIVCVIDTGLDVTHPDLQGNLWRNSREIPDNGVDDDGNGVVDDVHGFNAVDNTGDIQDLDGHGTHCAGSTGAVSNNSLGIAGVAPYVKLMGCKAVAGQDGRLVSSAAIACLDYCLANGAHITTNSWGGQGKDAQDEALRTAIRGVQDAGQLFVTAAGNNGADDDTVLDVPTGFGYDIILSAAASDLQDEVPSYSNFGQTAVHLAAPGSEIISTVPNNRYFMLSGTSMAAPQVAGAAALLLSLYGAAGANITGRGLELKHILMSSVERRPSLASRVASEGRLNVGRAVLGIPRDLPRYFARDSNAKLPFNETNLPDSLPFTVDTDLSVLDYQPTNPGSEIGAVASEVSTQALTGKGAEGWFHDSGLLSDGHSRYDCLCSSCLGPERVYAFLIPADNDTLPKWLSLRAEAQPLSQLVVSVFRKGSQGDVGVVSSSKTQASGDAENAMPLGQSMIGTACGGMREAVVNTVIEKGVQYYVIVDGMGGYSGSYNISFTSQPLAKRVAWQDIAKPGGLSVGGNLASDGLPLFKCMDRCPRMDCQNTPAVLYSFTPETDALLAFEGTPFSIPTGRGVSLAAGKICLVEGRGFLVGPCGAYGASDVQMCQSLNIEMPHFIGAHNSSIVQTRVRAGQETFLLVKGIGYAGDFSTIIRTLPSIADNPLNKEVGWDAMDTGGPFNTTVANQGFRGFLDAGLLATGEQNLDCPCMPGACQGPEVVYSFQSRAQGFVRVATWPYYGADDIGIDNDLPCRNGACFYGVFHHIYKETANQTIRVHGCNLKTPETTQKRGFKVLLSHIPVELVTRYYIVVDSLKGENVVTDNTYYRNSYSLSLAYEGQTLQREIQATAFTPPG